jgi:hypothetical protein
MSIMIETLERINKYCNLTEPFKSREEVEKQLDFFPFKLSDEVYEYYQWAGAPIGNYNPPQDWDDNSSGSYQWTYSCVLEQFLEGVNDLIHFVSLDEAREIYAGFSIYPHLYALECLPFVSYENGILVIAGSENQIDISPVLVREGNDDRLWFPSLTKMMMAMAESIETIGTLIPGGTRDDRGDCPNREEVQRQSKIWTDIAKKHGSPGGAILTN